MSTFMQMILSENREQNNNNLNRSNNRTWRPVATTLTEYNNAGSPIIHKILSL